MNAFLHVKYIKLNIQAKDKLLLREGAHREREKADRKAKRASTAKRTKRPASVLPPGFEPQSLAGSSLPSAMSLPASTSSADTVASSGSARSTRARGAVRTRGRGGSATWGTQNVEKRAPVSSKATAPSDYSAGDGIKMFLRVCFLLSCKH